jgi:hypothetical protein
MDSSSVVRVTEVKSPVEAHAGTWASGARRAMAYGPGSQRNLSCRRLGCGSSTVAGRIEFLAYRNGLIPPRCG